MRTQQIKYKCSQYYIIVISLNTYKLNLKFIFCIMIILFKVFVLYIWFNAIQSTIINF